MVWSDSAGLWRARWKFKGRMVSTINGGAHVRNKLEELCSNQYPCIELTLIYKEWTQDILWGLCSVLCLQNVLRILFEGVELPISHCDSYTQQITGSCTTSLPLHPLDHMCLLVHPNHCNKNLDPTSATMQMSNHQFLMQKTQCTK